MGWKRRRQKELEREPATCEERRLDLVPGSPSAVSCPVQEEMDEKGQAQQKVWDAKSDARGRP